MVLDLDQVLILNTAFLYNLTVRGEVWQYFGASLMAQQVKNPPAQQEIKDTRVGSLGHKDPWRTEMATHSSILAWKILWTEAPDRSQSMGSQRVGHDWATNTHTWQYFDISSLLRLYSIALERYLYSRYSYSTNDHPPLGMNGHKMIVKMTSKKGGVLWIWKCLRAVFCR